MFERLLQSGTEGNIGLALFKFCCFALDLADWGALLAKIILSPHADHIVAGGQPSDLTPTENIIKECSEEASIPLELARTAKPVGAVSYTTISSTGLKPDVLFTFDIQLPHDFTPQPQDGEVSGGCATVSCTLYLREHILFT